MQPPERTEIRTHSLTHFSIIAAFFFLSFFCCFLLTFCLVGLSYSHTNFVLSSLDQFSVSPIIYGNPSCPFFFFLVLIILSGNHRFIYADIGVVSSACTENRRWSVNYLHLLLLTLILSFFFFLIFLSLSLSLEYLKELTNYCVPNTCLNASFYLNTFPNLYYPSLYLLTHPQCHAELSSHRIPSLLTLSQWLLNRSKERKKKILTETVSFVSSQYIMRSPSYLFS